MNDPLTLCSKIVEVRVCGVTQFAPTSEGPVLSLFNTSLRFSPSVEQLHCVLKPERLGAGPEPGGGGRRSTLFQFDTRALQSLFQPLGFCKYSMILWAPNSPAAFLVNGDCK